jgi:hypothetical protein
MISIENETDFLCRTQQNFKNLIFLRRIEAYKMFAAHFRRFLKTFVHLPLELRYSHKF